MLHYTTYNLQPLDYSQYVIPTQPITFKQITIQSIRYTYTTYNLEALRLQSVPYTCTIYYFQANDNSINTLHLHNLKFATLKITVSTLHLHKLFAGLKITSTTPKQPVICN